MTHHTRTLTGAGAPNTRRQFITRATQLGALSLPLLSGWQGAGSDLGCRPTDEPIVFPTSPHAVPPGFPTPATAGLSNESLLSPREGDGVSVISIPQSNAVVENRDFYGPVHVTGSNVTFRNCRMVAAPGVARGLSATRGFREATGTVLEDCYIHGTSASTEVVVKLQGGGTLRRCDVGGGIDHIRALRDTTVKDCYLKTHFDDPGRDPHNDGIQLFGDANFLFEHNTILAPYRSQTSAFIIKSDEADIVNVTVRNNYCSGGAFTIYTRLNPGRRWVLEDVVVRDNVIEADSGKYGLISDNAGAVYFGNRVYDPVSQSYEPLPDTGG